MLPASLGAFSLDAPPLFMDLLALPRPLAHATFALLPVDTRLRCVEVNRAWRALLADTSLWSYLDLGIDSGCTRFSEALFRAAVAKAGGQLRVLKVIGREVSTPTILDALASNAASLMLLVANPTARYTSAEAVLFLEAAPSCVCHLRTYAENVEQAHRYLRNEPPYARLRLHGIDVNGEGQLDSLESIEALCADLIKHPSLTSISIMYASLGTAAAMRVVLKAAIELRLHVIGLLNCGCTRSCVPELMRLVSAGEVKAMVVLNRGVELFEAGADTDQFCAAVRASASLNYLTLNDCGPNPDVAAVAAFINARRQ